MGTLLLILLIAVVWGYLHDCCLDMGKGKSPDKHQGSKTTFLGLQSQLTS